MGSGCCCNHWREPCSCCLCCAFFQEPGLQHWRQVSILVCLCLCMCVSLSPSLSIPPPPLSLSLPSPLCPCSCSPVCENAFCGAPVLVMQRPERAQLARVPQPLPLPRHPQMQRLQRTMSMRLVCAPVLASVCSLNTRNTQTKPPRNRAHTLTHSLTPSLTLSLTHTLSLFLCADTGTQSQGHWVPQEGQRCIQGAQVRRGH